MVPRTVRLPCPGAVGAATGSREVERRSTMSGSPEGSIVKSLPLPVARQCRTAVECVRECAYYRAVHTSEPEVDGVSSCRHEYRF